MPCGKWKGHSTENCECCDIYSRAGKPVPEGGCLAGMQSGGGCQGHSLTVVLVLCRLTRGMPSTSCSRGTRSWVPRRTCSPGSSPCPTGLAWRDGGRVQASKQKHTKAQDQAKKLHSVYKVGGLMEGGRFDGAREVLRRPEHRTPKHQ